MTEYILCLVLFSIGLYAVLIKRNLIKIIIGICIMEYSVNIFFTLIGYRHGGEVPIFSPTGESIPARMVDPVPQALILTAIVIGVAVMSLIVAIALRIHQKYGTYDIRELRRLRG